MNKSFLAVTVCALSAFSSQIVWSDAVDESSGALQEIVVTAQKREESAQKTPVSMNVYGSAEIAQKDLVDLQTLAQTDPNLNFNRNGGEATLAIRGVTTNNTTELGNPSVPVGVDNFFTNRAAALDLSLFDIERIEVLLGPQGTLFGRSSVGGLVNITTAKPTKVEEAAGSLELGNYDAVNATGMVNLPVNDWLQLRAAFSARRHDGYRTNTYLPQGSEPDKADDEDSHAGRVTAAFEPTDDFRGWVSFGIQNEGGAGPAIDSILWHVLPNGDISHERPNIPDVNAFPMYGTPWQRISDKVAKWNFQYDGIPDGITLQYLGGYDTYDWRHATSSISFFSFLATTPNLFLPYRPFVQTEAPITQNHEIRIASAPTGVFTWQSGLYYFHEANDLSSAGILDAGQADATPLLTFNYHVVTKSEAAYAQGAVHFLETSAVSIGVRYSKDDVARTGTFGLPIFGIPPGPNGNGSTDNTKVTWHAGYDLNWTPTNLLYAKVDTGYKPGGFEICGSFGPETVTTGEVGSKNRWNGDRMQFNASGFYSDYKNEQISQYVSNCLQGTVTTNSGRSKIYGLESDFKTVLDPIGTFDVGFSYLHADYSTLALPPTIGNGGAASCARTESVPQASGPNQINCILDGNVMPQSPRETVSAGFDHVWENIASGSIDFRVEGRFTSTQYYDPFDYNDTKQPSYTLLNSYIGYKRDHWRVSFYGRNLTNKGYINYGQENTAGGASNYSYSFGDPRVFGVRFEASLK